MTNQQGEPITRDEAIKRIESMAFDLADDVSLVQAVEMAIAALRREEELRGVLVSAQKVLIASHGKAHWIFKDIAKALNPNPEPHQEG